MVIINSGYNTLIYGNTTAPSGQGKNGNTSPADTVNSAKFADQVTLYSVDKALAANENSSTQSIIPAQEKLLAAASSGPARAEKIA